MTKSREAFERIHADMYEGDFTKYGDGEYVNEKQESDFRMFVSGWQACDAHWREECLKEWSGLIRNPHFGQEIKPNDVMIDWADLLKLKNAEKRLREKLQSEEMAWRCSEALWRRNYPNGGSIYPTYESTPYHYKVIYNEEAKTVIAAISKEMGV